MFLEFIEVRELMIQCFETLLGSRMKELQAWFEQLTLTSLQNLSQKLLSAEVHEEPVCNENHRTGSAELHLHAARTRQSLCYPLHLNETNTGHVQADGNTHMCELQNVPVHTNTADNPLVADGRNNMWVVFRTGVLLRLQNAVRILNTRQSHAISLFVS